jgi:mono/diheme cytochrome c family protein
MRGQVLRLLAACAFLSTLSGCYARPRFTEPLKLAGGRVVAPEVLNDGHDAYMLYCYACHGEKGDGRGPSAPGMRPPPRDFTTGAFKFGGVQVPTLPHDEELADLIKRGLAGTPMLPWDISDRERNAIVQYLKTFSPRWKEEPPGDRVLPDSRDPWEGKEDDARAIGKQLYHFVNEVKPGTTQPSAPMAGCNKCHPSYVTAAELATMAKEIPAGPAEPRESMHWPTPTSSEDFRLDGRPTLILPTDFLFHPIKNGTTVPALFRTIAAGINGAAMPTWKGGLKDADIWALAHYVKGLADIRGTPEALALSTRLTQTK